MTITLEHAPATEEVEVTEDTITLTMPRDWAESLMVFLHYSPTSAALNQIVDPEHGEYDWDNSPAYEIFYALQNAGAVSRYWAGGHARLNKVNK